MTACDDARARLAPEPGPLPATPEAHEAFAHYAECPACQEFFRTHQHLAARIRRAARDVRAPEDLAERILTAIDSPAREVPARQARSSLWFPGLAVASAAVIALWLGPPLGRDPLAARPFLEQALAADGMARTTPGRVPAQLAAWFDSQRISGFAIPEIEDATMYRGRVTWVAGSRSAAVDFETPEGNRLTYLMVPDAAMFGGVRESEIWAMSADGWEVAMWVEGGTARAVLSRMPRDQLMAIAERCRSKRVL